VLYLSLTKLCSIASFTRAPHYFTPTFTYVEKNNSFSLTQQKHYGWIYYDNSFSGLQSFPPIATRLRGIRQILSRPKSKKKIISLIASLSFA